jgi:hypothetical protein
MEVNMETNPLNKPVPALALAFGLTALSHKANANAARALGVPISIVALLVGGLLVIGGLRSE